MARHRRRVRHRSHGSRGLIRGVSNTTLAIGAAAAYFLMRPTAPVGTAGFGYSGSGLGDIYHGFAGTRTISPGLGAVLQAAALKSQPWSWSGANYSWGRPSMPLAGHVIPATGFRPGLHGLGAMLAHLRGSLGGFQATHGFWQESIGLGHFNNVSLNRRWWT
jgi:hypothetical protein